MRICFCILALFLVAATDGGEKPATPPPVSALGWLRPGEEVIRIETPYFMQEPPVVGEILVTKGQRVKAGQVLARTQHHALARAQVAEALADLAVAQRKYDLVQAGGNPELVNAAEANIKNLEAQMTFSETSVQRRVPLTTPELISKEQFDAAQLQLEASRQQLERARHELTALRTPRQEDVALAQAEVAAAAATLARQEAQAAFTEIRSPIDGMVLAINARPGERTGPLGLLELGDVDHMNVEAEVYVSDIRNVAVGAPAVVTSEAFAGQLAAHVTSLEPRVKANRVLDLDPREPRERRVVAVTLSLEHPEPVATLSGAEVTVLINPR